MARTFFTIRLAIAMCAMWLSSCTLLPVDDAEVHFPISQKSRQLPFLDKQKVIASVLEAAKGTLLGANTENCLQHRDKDLLIAESCYFIVEGELVEKRVVYQQKMSLHGWFSRLDTFDLPKILIDRLQKAAELHDLGSDKPVVLFVFDTSGSMADLDQGEPKITTARKSIIDTISRIDVERYNTSLVVFDQDRRCQAKLAIAPGSEDSDSFIKQIRGIQPWGPTPLAAAIAMTGEVLSKIDKKMVVLFSDGLESCGGDPVKEAKILDKKYGIKINLQVIGYGLDPATERQLKEIAEVNPAWGYYPVADAATLEGAIASITQQGELFDPVWVNASTSTFQFESGSSALQQSYMDNIQKLYRYLKNNDKNIEIIGHTDSIGSGENNLRLSVQRADMVKAKLVELGIDRDRISVSGKGESEPVSSNETEAGRLNNRRVVIRVQ